MEEQLSPGDLILLSKVDSPAAVLIANSAGGTGLILGSQISNIVNTKKTIEMYKVLINGKISHITKDRIVKIIAKRKVNGI
jgi:hydrogenase maturation factor HypF (carbamoyltransferase family)